MLRLARATPRTNRRVAGKLRALLDMGVSCFKSDFGERIPTDVVYFDGADPERMYNFYSYLYNQTVFEPLAEQRGPGEAVVFARSATVGGRRFPVHWGADSTTTFESMAETLRGGLSLAMCGFGFGSHDIGGFEGTPDPAVFKRWIARTGREIRIERSGPPAPWRVLVVGQHTISATPGLVIPTPDGAVADLAMNIAFTAILLGNAHDEDHECKMTH